ncbi:PREDICTED: uncharacterized protein LOC108558520 [Nicrophorus vespilloides]|uniref:Uncharacterized protein LOC108558520 n=1 Tax=Nicrophorus vespilloides TaxID=110193 RepID=A0ABM1M8N9_NICVS|nr:PREDICTED: uncharacterized protein LOC108558520 [Nicrophorus vespilloides]
MGASIRNLGAAPDLQLEGVLIRPLKIPPDLPPTEDWHRDMSPSDRLHYHQTLSSVRRYAHFKPIPGIIPLDALDLVLGAKYDQGVDLFGEKIDVVLQGSTMGTDRRAKMRNTLELKAAKDAIGIAHLEAMETKSRRSPFFTDFTGSAFGPVVALDNFRKVKDNKLEHNYNKHHVLYVGGISEKRHPCNVKLMNSSHHSPQTNAGYSRQDRDGNSYQY